MTVPEEYRQASRDFEAVLVDLRDTAMLSTTHRAYTTLEAVLRAFRSRLTVEQGLEFADVLPVGLRALFVSDWNINAPVLSFLPHDKMMVEVMALRHNHNLSTQGAIDDVTAVLRRHLDERRLRAFLSTVSPDALRFWGYSENAD